MILVSRRNEAMARVVNSKRKKKKEKEKKNKDEGNQNLVDEITLSRLLFKYIYDHL